MQNNTVNTIQLVIQRLTIIQASIGLEDSNLLQAQSKQLDSLINQLDDSQRTPLSAISQAIDKLDYPTALSGIQQYISNMTNVAVYQDPEVSALKLELAGLEERLNLLHSERNDHLTELDDFNRLYTIRVGASISEILRLQMMIAHRHAEQSGEDTSTSKQQYLEAQQDYQEYHKDYQQQLEEDKPAELNKDEKQRIKKAFQQASKLCHPDMVADELKEQATELFQVLSEAYRNKDLKKVEDILAKLQSDGIFVTASEQINDKDSLQQHIITLRQRIASILAEISSIKNDDTYQLIQSLDGDYDDYINEKAEQLNVELERLREELRDGLL